MAIMSICAAGLHLYLLAKLLRHRCSTKGKFIKLPQRNAIFCEILHRLSDFTLLEVGATFRFNNRFLWKTSWKILNLGKARNLTISFIIVNSSAQLFYLIGVAPCEITFMITGNWPFGSIMCKFFKSWKAVAAGKFTNLRSFGTYRIGPRLRLRKYNSITYSSYNNDEARPHQYCRFMPYSFHAKWLHFQPH